MENQSIPEINPAKHSSLSNLLRLPFENPVIMKELRSRMRGRQAFILLTGYLALIGLVIGLVYLSLSSQSLSPAWTPDFRQGVGKAIFGTVVLLELLLVSFIGPALTSGAITSERERQTYDLVRTTTLSERSFVFGKLGSSLAFLLLLVFAGLPIESIAFLLGGVGVEEILISSLLLVVTALFYCTLGLFFSSFMKRTLAATVTSYSAILLSYVVLGLAFYLMVTLIDVGNNSTSANSNFWGIVITGILWLFVSTNPLLAAIISEVILVDEQSLFMTTQSPFGGLSIHLPSPWIPFTLIFLSLTFLMISITTHRVRQPER